MKIKIIELLNKNANGEEMPEKIKWDNLIYVLKQDSIDGHFYYIREKTDYSVGNLFFSDLTMGDLNDEVEIIEEDKTIEEFDFDYNAEKLVDIIIQMKQKINELVKEINKMKEKENG